MIEIRILDGGQAKALVDPFYVRNGGRPCAREDDLFFLALDGTALHGCVRFCVENETPMLRTMMIDAEHRRRGIGSRLLKGFAAYLDEHRIQPVYCLPYAHLPDFYASVGFQPVSFEETPAFLQERMRSYDPSGNSYLCMRRP